MVKFIFNRNGDFLYKSPFNGEEYLFIGKNSIDIVNLKDIELLKKCDGFIEVKLETVADIELKTIETYENVKAIPIGKTAPISKTKKIRRVENG